jgi:riboflavin kinase/FMN adenylyltransferase
MAVWRSLDEVDPQLGSSVVTIGVFDGVHRGHRSVLAYAVQRSRQNTAADLPVVAVTFDPHPVAILAPARMPALLTRIDRRAQLLAEAGAQHVLALPFDRGMADWSPEEFVQRVLVDILHAEAVVVGENFRFGHRAAGDISTLTRLGAAHGFSLHALTLQGVDSVWSSTLIRGHLADGDVESAADALGRLFTVEGVVVRGDQRGRQLGYPTANVPTSAGTATPADGVYAGWLRRLDDPAAKPLPAAISVGTNPTFDGIEHRVESYVLDRDDLELYDVPVEVSFVRRLRGQVRFDDVEALVEQMDADCDAARTLLTAADPG